MRASATSDSTPTRPPRLNASLRAPPRARAPRPHRQTAALPLIPSVRPASPTPTWPCCNMLIMRRRMDSRRHILTLLAFPYRPRRACTPAPCFQVGLRRPVRINRRRVLRARHYPLRVRRRNQWFPTMGIPLPRRTLCHPLVKAPQCRPRPSRHITSSTHLPRLQVIPRIGRRITPGRRRPAIRPRRRPVLRLLPSAPVPSHPALRLRSRLEKKARTVWRHRKEGITICLVLVRSLRLYTVRIVLVLHFPFYALFSARSPSPPLFFLLFSFWISQVCICHCFRCSPSFDSGLGTATVIITIGTIEFSAYLLYLKGALFMQK